MGGDGIVNINGIDHAMYGEVVIFDTGTKGMVQEIRRDSIGCILLGDDDNICEGTRVVRTLKKAGIPVSEGYLGRVTNALGAPIDGKGEITAAQYRPIENDAPGIVDRKSVCVPMETGILSIDSMFPIGRGQRELIIGDRQTGKTSIAIDAISTKRAKTLCAYMFLSDRRLQRVAKIVNTLKSNGAMDYTAVIASTASEPRQCSILRRMPELRLRSTLCTAARTFLLCMTICQSMPWRTARFHCCSNAALGVKHIPATFSIFIQGFWSVRRICAMTSAVQ